MSSFLKTDSTKTTAGFVIRTVAPLDAFGAIYPPCLADRDIRSIIERDQAEFAQENGGTLNYAVELRALVYAPDDRLTNRAASLVQGVACSLRRAGVPVFVNHLQGMTPEGVHFTDSDETRVELSASIESSANPPARAKFYDALQSACRRISDTVVANNPDTFDMQPNEDYR